MEQDILGRIYDVRGVGIGMTDSGPRAQARKDLRDYDNPKGGRNLKYQDTNYLNSLLDKYKFANEEAFRVWSNSARKGRKKI